MQPAGGCTRCPWRLPSNLLHSETSLGGGSSAVATPEGCSQQLLGLNLLMTPWVVCSGDVKEPEKVSRGSKLAGVGGRSCPWRAHGRVAVAGCGGMMPSSPGLAFCTTHSRGCRSELQSALIHGFTWPWGRQRCQEGATAALKVMKHKSIPKIMHQAEGFRWNLINLWLIGEVIKLN